MRTSWWPLLLLPAFLIFYPPLHADEIARRDALRVIIGEAADQGMHGMICVGEILRHRGSIRGFTGFWADHISREPPSVWREAGIAWDTSARTNYTKGADHFYDKRRYYGPPWGRNFVKTYEYKDHVFYKEISPSRR